MNKNRYQQEQGVWDTQSQRHAYVWWGPDHWVVQMTDDLPRQRGDIEIDGLESLGAVLGVPEIVPWINWMETMSRYEWSTYVPVAKAHFSLWNSQTPYKFAIAAYYGGRARPDDVIVPNTFRSLAQYFVNVGMDYEDTFLSWMRPQWLIPALEWNERIFGRLLFSITKHNNFYYWGGER